MGKFRLPEVISIDEFNILLAGTKKKEHRLSFKLGFFCGLRLAEVLNLKESDIDYNRGFIFIRQGKGNKDRYVPIASPVKADLKHLPISIGRRALQKAIKVIAKETINKDIHFHTLRHSCATHCLNNGMNIADVQRLLGHSRIDTTGIYLHVNPEGLKNKFDEIWK